MGRMSALQDIIMVFEYINSTGLWVLGLVLFVAVIAGGEFGLRLGRHANRSARDKDASSLASASLGLLALLIAFTYSIALGRYDLRRNLVLEEANAIGSTANFALMLPPSDQPEILAMLKKYAEIRLNLGIPYNPAKMRRDVATSNQLLATLWSKAVTVTAAAPQSLPTYRFVASLNETNNIAEKRVTALRNHVPVIITIMLATTALISMGFAGYSAGVSGVDRRISTLILGALLAFLIVLTQDLARPDRGAIEVSNQALADALAGIPQPTIPTSPSP